MNIISKAAQRGRQLRIPLVLVLFSLILGTHGCVSLDPDDAIGCGDIPITVAPGTCTFFPPPPCFGDREPTFVLADSLGRYTVIGNERVGFQFCAADLGLSDSGTDRVAYMLTQGLQFGRGDFVVTLRSVDVTVSDSPDPVSVGSDLTYTITLTNRRPVSISGYTLTDDLPANVTFVSGLAAGCGLETETNTITCGDIGIAAGASITYQFVVRPTTPGTLTNSLTVDPSLIANTVTNTTTVNPASGADLAVTITDSPDPVIRGATVTYTITVTNNGPTAATGVRLTDLLPPLEVFTIVVSQGSFTTNQPSAIIGDFGTLASGASATLTVTGSTFTTGTITNTATVTANEADPDTANNTASENTMVNLP